MNRKLLIVEDEPSIRELIRMALETEGFTDILEAEDGEKGLRLAQQKQPNLILLDLMMPQMDGLAVCRQLKRDEATRAIPIIMLTAKAEEEDVVLGLEMGASDYVTKPFSRKILLARVRAQLRDLEEFAVADEIRRGGLTMDVNTHLVKLDGEEIFLTCSEFEILKMLLTHSGRVYTRNQIILGTKGEGYPVTERSVDVQIVSLRKKLGTYGAAAIETIRGIGYRFREDC